MFNEYGCLMEAAATPSGKRTSTETQLIGLGKKPRNMCSTGSSDLDQFNIPRRKSVNVCLFLYMFLLRNVDNDVSLFSSCC
jgi:hypothetical protein